MLEGFWPSSNWRANYEHASTPKIIDVDLENLVIPPYYGPRSMRPFLNIVPYMPFYDLFVCNRVLVRLTYLTIFPVWMGRAESDVVKDQNNENYRKVYVQWWVLVRKGVKNDEELYYNYWLNKWKSVHVDPKQWVKISCVAFSFSAKNNIIIHSMISINAIHAFKAKTNLDAINNNSCAL